MPRVKVIWILHRYTFRTTWGEFTKNTLHLLMVFYLHACTILVVLAQDSEGITVCKSSNAMYAPQLAL